MQSELDPKTLSAIIIAAPISLIAAFAVCLATIRRIARLRRRAEADASADGTGRQRATSGDRLSHFVDEDTYTGALVRLWLGLIVAACSAGTWIATEQVRTGPTDTRVRVRVLPTMKRIALTSQLWLRCPFIVLRLGRVLSALPRSHGLGT